MKTPKKTIPLILMRNKYLLGISIGVILVAGISALFSMPRLEDPVITNRNPLITTIFPGASAQRVEALVTEKLEEAMKEVSEIKKIDSVSRAGISILQIELQDSVTSETNQKVFSLIRDKLDDAVSKLPPEVQNPVLDEKRGAVAYTLVVALSWQHDSPLRLGILGRLAEDLADQLRNLPGTEIVRLFGEPSEEITVSVKHDEMAALGLTPAIIAKTIASADAKVPAGVLRGDRSDAFIEVRGELDSLNRIRQIPLQEGPKGDLLKLGDVAQVARSWQDPPSAIAISDGHPAVLVAARVSKEIRGDQWAKKAAAVVESFAAETDPNIGITTVFDQMVYTQERLEALSFNLLLGAIVVVCVAFLIMGWRASLLVGVALPLVAAMTLVGISFFGGALHQMSIFGMIIALGLLIDNAIVVVDEIRKHLSSGRSPQQAVSAAVKHLSVPLVSSTLTTVLAFMPILLLPGNVGDFIGLIGGSVIIALISSLFMALTVIAALTGLLGTGANRNDKHRWWRDGLHSTKLTAIYRKILSRSFRRPWFSMVLVSLIPVAGFMLAPTLKSEFFPRTDRNMFEIQVWLPTDATITHTQRTASAIEALLLKRPDVSHVNWLIGGSFPSVYYNLIMDQDNAANYANAIVTATSFKAVKRMIPEIQAELDKTVPGAQIVINQFAQGPPSPADIELKLYGPDIQTLQNIGEQLRLIIAEHPEMLHTRVSMPRGEAKLWLNANENEVRMAGLSLTEISGQIQGSLEGGIGGTVLEDLEEMPVRIRWKDERRRQLNKVEGINFSSPDLSDNWIPLAAIGSFELRPELGGISRSNGVRVNTISGYVSNDALPLEVNKNILARVEESGIYLPAGYRIEVGGYSENQSEAVGKLTLYLPILLTIMAGTVILSFKSFRIAIIIGLIAVLAVGLGLLSTRLANFPLSFNSLLGIAGLIGLALNDSIVVLAAIRASRAAKSGTPTAMADVVVGCSRHLISTTLTTIGGFLPLLLFVGGDFWPPLAIVLSGGVGGSTLLAMVFVPSAYRIFMGLKGSFQKPFAQSEASVIPIAVNTEESEVGGVCVRCGY